MTAGKDGSLGIWKFVVNNGEGTKDADLVLAPKITQDNVIERVNQISRVNTNSQSRPFMITAAKWVSSTDIVVCLKNGDVVLVQNASDPDLMSKKVLTTLEYNPAWSMQVVSSSGDGFNILLGLESGEITMI